MANEKIVIASLDLDVDELVKRASETKKAIDALRQSNRDLAKAEGDNSAAIATNEAELRNLTAQYRRQSTAVSSMIGQNSELLNSQQAITIALDKEINSVNDARASNAELLKLRNELNLSTEEGQRTLLLLNGALNKNNEFIKQNASELEKQKINIGNYGNAFTEAAQSINRLNGGLLGFASRAHEAGGAGVLLKTALGGMTGSLLQLIKASLAFLATPLGAALGLLTGAFLAVKAAMNRSEEAGGKVSKLFAILGGVFNTVLKVLQPLGEFVIDKLVGAFETLGKVAEGASKLVSSALSFLGFDEAAKSVDEFTNSTKESIKASQDLANAEKELEKAQRNARLIQLQFQKDAEKLRQIRDDETKSIAERIKANDDLGATLQKQIGEELKIAQLRLEVVNKQIAQQGKTKELLDAQAEALTEIVDIEERITGQQSEQLVNRVALLKEENEKREEARQKRIDNAIKEQSDLIRLFEAEQGFKAKTLEETFLIEQELTQKRLKLLETEFANKRKTETEYQAERLEIENDFLLKSAQLNEEFARRELEAQLAQLPEIIGKEKFISDAILQAENERLTQIETLRKDFEAKRFEQGLISETEYQNSITSIQQEIQTQRDEAEALRLATIDEKNKIDLENKRAIEDELFAQDLEIQLGRLEQQRLIEVEAAEKVGADIDAINEKYKLKEIKTINEIKEARKQAQLSELSESLKFYGNLLGALETFFGKNKQLATATAIINGALAVTEILKTPSLLPEPLATASRVVSIGTVVATTAKNVSEINSAKFEKGGAIEIGGKRHSAGGTMFIGSDGTSFEAEQGELIGVMNRNASQQFMAFNDAFLSKGLEQSSIINYEQLASAMANTPAPIVIVDEIVNATNRKITVDEFGNF